VAAAAGIIASAAVRSISARPTRSVRSAASAVPGSVWQRWQQAEERAEVKAPPTDVAGSIELNQRQRDLFDEVVRRRR